MDGERSGCRKQFGASNSREDEGSSEEGATAKMLVQDEVGSQACEDRFEGEEDRGVGGGEVLLGPALDGEGCGGGKEAGDGESDDEVWGDGEVRSSAQGESDGHNERGYADLEGSELTGGDSVRCVREG